MSEEVWTLVQCLAAASLTNINSSKIRYPSQHSRSEGWTEVFGNLKKRDKSKRADGGSGGNGNGNGNGESKSEEEKGADTDNNTDDRYWKAEDDFVSRTLETAESRSFVDGDDASIDIPSVRLSQYRVAWQEQLLLRMCGVPHSVSNSPYASTESTGALPSLLDIDHGALVGPRTTNAADNSHADAGSGSSGDTVHENGIVNYLLTSPDRRTPFADPRFTPEQKRKNRLCTGLLRNELHAILTALRFGCSEAWRDVYRPRCVNACIDPDGERDVRREEERRAAGTSDSGGGVWGRLARSIRGTDTHDDDTDDNDSGGAENGGNGFHAMAWFQAWSERAVHMKRLTLSDQHGLFPDDTKEVDVPRALALARDCYDILNSMLVETPSKDKDDDDAVTYRLLGTDEPSVVETLLFAHVAEALCDVHLVVVLKDYPLLVRFFQTTYRTYFGTGYALRYPGLESTTPSSPSSSSSSSSPSPSTSWIRHADRKNLLNQFHRLVLPLPPAYSSSAPEIRSSAPHCHDLPQILADLSARRIEERKLGLGRRRKSVEGMMHRWRMGGTMGTDDGVDDDKGGANTEKGTASSGGSHGGGDGGGGGEEEDMDGFARKNRKHMDEMKREAKTQDELWISGVVVSMLFGFVLAAAKSSGEGDS